MGRTCKRRSQSGQAMAEYIILLVVIALAAIFVFAAFGDRLRAMVTGVTVTLGGTADDSMDKTSMEIVRELDQTGLDYGTN